jgi:spore germination protein
MHPIKTLITLLFFIFTTAAFASENVFYTLRDNSSDRVAPWDVSLAAIKKYHQKISILVPQTYIIRADGDVGGKTDDTLIETAEHYHIKIMPLVTNSLFDTAVVHQFLHDDNAKTNALNTLLTNCQTKHFDGLQFDFEMVALDDRDALTAFFKQAADLFHKNKLHISFAVAPVTSNNPQTYFQKKLYENWEGAYDLKVLGEFADFISIMTYDQHASGTTPGTTAGYDWVNQVILNALKSVPAKKISLGIPGYSTHWYLGHEAHHTERTHVNMEALSYADTAKLIAQHHAKLIWDSNAKINYTIFLSDWLNQYVFIEDAKSFAFKYSLAKKYHLRGISYFDLGSEDPRMWEWV